VNHFDTPSSDEFEDVPSPFRKTTTRSNMFARPVGTVPSEPPVVPAATTRRAPVKALEDQDFLPPRRRAVSVPQVEYLDETEDEDEEEDEVVEKRPARARAKPKSKDRSTLLPRIGWGIAALLLLRMAFMERGLIQYWRMSGTIGERETELARVRRENQDIRGELRRIEFDKGHQRWLAKEHLGVIAADEFLILFAGEGSETQSGAGRPL
jgi:hypothetical protein